MTDARPQPVRTSRGVGFPLYARILLWFLLNLLLLALGFYIFVRVQFRYGFDSLLLSQAAERIQAVSAVIVTELQEAPAESWDEILERFGSAYGVEIRLFQGSGMQVAGPPVELPVEVRARLEVPPGRGERLGPGAERGRGPPWATDDERALRPRFRGGLREVGPPRFMVRTGHPTRYWYGTRFPLEWQPRVGVRTGVLLMTSPSLAAGGLFFDPLPWILVSAIMLLLSVLFWIPLMRGITRAISRLTDATTRIAEGRLETRVNANRRDELGRLGQSINRMAGQLSGWAEGQKRFLGDIAHELCSPLARIQVALGILKQRAAVDTKEQAYLADVEEEVRHMSALVDELLSFSRASLKGGTQELQSVPLRPLLDEVVSRENPEGHQVQLTVAEDLSVLADPDLLKRSLANLLRNALRYAGPAGPVSVSARAHDREVTVTVGDSGPGVPAEALERVFDPFYRVDPSRDRSTGGVGLGLAIVKTCIEACQGQVKARNREPHGFEVTLTLRRTER